MIEINLKGGLGNQMFQYAAAKHLSIAYNTNLVLNTEYFSHIPKGDVPRKYQLAVFHIDTNAVMREKIAPFRKFTQRCMQKVLSENIQIAWTRMLLSCGIPVHLNGYFQSEAYFKGNRDLLLKEFTLAIPLGSEAQRLEKLLGTSNSVCINIRRGDYLRPDYIKIYGLCSMEYYRQAIAYMNTKVTDPLFCIFSDDPEWVQKEFSMTNAIFAGNDILKDYEQMHLMSVCKHNIIANSSFAWWGAWLNQNQDKIVIGPKQWFTKKTSDELGILPKEWIQI